MIWSLFSIGFILPLKLLLSVITLPLFLAGLVVWGPPPIIPTRARFLQYFKASWLEGRQISLINRLIFFLFVVSTLLKAPINGVCWYIDDVLFPSYHKTKVGQLLFLVPGMRTGSTQLAHYLEDDEETFIAPQIIELYYPFIWVWKLFSLFAKLGIPIKSIMHKVNDISEERKKYHEFDVYRTNTFEGTFWIWQMNLCSVLLGPAFMIQEFDSSIPRNDTAVQKEVSYKLVQLAEALIKKVRHYHGKHNHHFLLKGHYLSIAYLLEKQYPNAYFLTIIRHPVSRLHSFVNYAHIVFTFEEKVPISWECLVQFAINRVLLHSEHELDFFYYKYKKQKIVITFDKYIEDLSSTLEQIYKSCNIDPVPALVLERAAILEKTTHDRTEKRKINNKNYKSLASLKIDELEIEQKLKSYIQWMNKL